nr:hypothetical protein [Paracoccus saliphilus]
MNKDKQNLLRGVLKQHQDPGRLFDRLAQEYRATGDAGKQELFLAVAAELATAQAAVGALAAQNRMAGSTS